LRGSTATTPNSQNDRRLSGADVPGASPAHRPGWIPEPKPSHRLVDPERHKSRATLDDQRRRYDEYIANLDAEFGRLIDALRTSGVLDTSYVIVTSDHGEQFERGFAGHGSPLLYDPVVRVPLVISAPGQSSRRDVHIPTASVDVVPTLAQLSGGPVPNWCEGQVLPGLGGAEDAERSLFIMEAKLDNPHKPFTQASFAMRRGRYKLIDYMGYPQYRVQHRFEMYDMASDPDELNNIYTETMSAAWSMKEELLARIARADALYVKSLAGMKVRGEPIRSGEHSEIQAAVAGGLAASALVDEQHGLDLVVVRQERGDDLGRSPMMRSRTGAWMGIVAAADFARGRRVQGPRNDESNTSTTMAEAAPSRSAPNTGTRSPSPLSCPRRLAIACATRLPRAPKAAPAANDRGT